MISWSRDHLLRINFALYNHRRMDSCCRRWLMACALGMWPREEAFEAICLMTSRLEGVHKPRDSTTRGKNSPPASSTCWAWRVSFSASPACCTCLMGCSIEVLEGAPNRNIKIGRLPLLEIRVVNIPRSTVPLSTVLFTNCIVVVLEQGMPDGVAEGVVSHDS